MSLIKNTELYLTNLVNELGYDIDNIKLVECNLKELGEFQINFAMQLAKKYHQNPIEIAKKVVEKLDDRFKNVNIAGPGFINLTFNDKYLIENANIGINDFNNYIDKEEPKKIIIDFGGANAAKALHVGHMRSANIGEALRRLAILFGNDVISDVHLGDIGRQSGMLITELQEEQPELPYFNPNYKGEYPNINLTSKDLGRMYPKASIKAKEDPDRMEKVRYITSLIDKGEAIYTNLWRQMVNISIKDIKKVYDMLNCHFDLFEGELDSYKYIDKTMEVIKPYLYESEGAKVIDVKEDTDTLEIPPLMVIKNDGATIYATRELATIYGRIERFNPDEIWYVVDERQSLYFTQVFRASYKTKLVDNCKLLHLGFGTINGIDGKPFKTRDGGVMELSSLIELIKNEIKDKIKDEITGDEREEIADLLSIATLKYTDLLPFRKTDYIFDPVKFSSLEGKTGPYILYATVRIKSLLNKVDDKEYKIKEIYNNDISSILNKLVLLPVALLNSYKEKTLNYITDYIYEIASLYNKFYNNNNILNEIDVDKKETYIALSKLVYNVMHNILDILAIDEVGKM